MVALRSFANKILEDREQTHESTGDHASNSKLLAELVVFSY